MKPLFNQRKTLEKTSTNYENMIFEIRKQSRIFQRAKDKNQVKSNNNKINGNHIQKRKNKIKNNNSLIKFYIIILMEFKMVCIFFQLKSNIIFDLINFENSKITLKIKGTGNISILGNNFQNINYLNEVIINGNKTDTLKNIYYFNQIDNYVELIWDENITSCAFMFFRCSNIIEINLSNFNTSKVTSMNNMFSGCS